MSVFFNSTKIIRSGFIALLLAGCTGPLAERAAAPSEGLLPPVLNPVTKINKSLRELPPPVQKVAIAVYGYTDQTGQFKPVDNVQTLSRAVTQGATSVLIKALQDAGEGTWFTVVERERLDNLMKERKIISDMRGLYLGERGVNPRALPPLLFAGVLLEGGIVGYDSNTRTGGAGAKYLGIGGDVKFREDTVTVYIRAISTKTGEVLVSTVAHKTVLSIAIQGGAFKFVALDRILEAEAGFTTNEPEQIAVQQAIEKATHAMIVEGAARNLWAFADHAYQAREIDKFYQEQQTLGPVAARASKDGAKEPSALASAAAGSGEGAKANAAAPAAQNQQPDQNSPQPNAVAAAQNPVPSTPASAAAGAAKTATKTAKGWQTSTAADAPSAPPASAAAQPPQPGVKRTPAKAPSLALAPPGKQAEARALAKPARTFAPASGPERKPAEPIAMLAEADRLEQVAARPAAPVGNLSAEPDFQPSPEKMGTPLAEAP